MPRLHGLSLLLLVLGAGAAHAGETKFTAPQASSTTSSSGVLTVPKIQTLFQKKAQAQSPSFEGKRWTGTLGAYETNVQYDYVGGGSQNLGNSQNQNISEEYLDVRQTFMRHTLLVFLAQGGVEFQHQGFDSPSDSLVPDRLDTLDANVGLDAHWSQKDLLHLEVRPGFYTDFQGAGWNAFNTPIDVGYTRVVSNSFQWVLGFNYNGWRSTHILGSPGFRWQINERWKLKAYLPTPDIEYAALPSLTLTMGGDFRGDSYRVGPHFGDSLGHPDLNSALVDYQEIRIGPGFSWNVRPLIEINFKAGYMIGRQFDFHNDGVVLNGSGGPFVSLAVHALFKFPGQPLVIPERNNVSIHNILSYF